MTANSFYKKANTFAEIDNAVRFDIPINADHEFYTNFADVRGDFEEKSLYRALNVNPQTHEYNLEANPDNKTLLFLAGMRGSGKTSELAKIAQQIAHPKGLFPIICNLDEGLDLNDMEYMDILIFQLERLFQELQQKEIQLSSSQLQSVEAAFKKFFVAADQLRKDNPPPPPPPVDPKVKAAFDKLEKERDEAIRKVLSAEQYEKYKTAAKRMQPPPPGEGGKEGPPPPPRQ